MPETAMNMREIRTHRPRFGVESPKVRPESLPIPAGHGPSVFALVGRTESTRARTVALLGKPRRVSSGPLGISGCVKWNK